MNAEVTSVFIVPILGESWQTCTGGGLQWLPQPDGSGENLPSSA